jgi:hypothetical protein
VKARELSFRSRPRARVSFAGAPRYDSASGSDRTNLPGRVTAGVTYLDVVVHYRLAAKLAKSKGRGG